MFHTIWIYLINIFVICNLFGQEFLYYSVAEYNSKIIKPEQVIGFEIGLEEEGVGLAARTPRTVTTLGRPFISMPSNAL